MARSRVMELAEEEAARAEALEDEDETDEDGEPVESGAELEDDLEAIEEETEGEWTPLEPEALAEALEVAIAAHAANLQLIFGPDFGLMEPCPMCSSLGALAPDSILLDPDTERCPKCHGHGAFLTESFVDTQRARQCPQCLGNGYVPKAVPVAPVAATGNASAPIQSVTPVIPPMPIYDPHTNTWRDPSGNVLSSSQS